MASVLPFEQNSAGRRTQERAITSDGFAAFLTQVRADRDRSLKALIESEIIPRLMVVHATEPTPPHSIDSETIVSPCEIESFTSMVMALEADVLLTHIDSILARGTTIETVMVDLLAPAARLLGEYWEDDRCDFVDVTMGLWRLQEVVYEIASRAPAKRFLTAGGHRALFASMPGDQHSFGTVVIDELFRCNGWVTERISEAETVDLLKQVENDWFDMIGLTISCDCHIGTLPSIVAALRNVSRNPRVCIMIGGRVIAARPDLVERVGADGTARDAKLALEVAAELVRQREWEAADCH